MTETVNNVFFIIQDIYNNISDITISLNTIVVTKVNTD